MHLYKQLRNKINYLVADQIEQIKKAYLIASVAHLEQKRDNGDKYIIHPVAVACILADIHIDYQSIIAALLHDLIEDTCITKEEIISRFGHTVADLVDGLTKLSKIEFSNQLENHAQSFRKMVLAMSRDIRVILIKLADRWHNMQTINEASHHKRHRIAKETLDIYAPIANRLGMHDMSIALENLAFAVLYPLRFKILKKAIEKDSKSHTEIISTIEKELTKAFHENSMENTKILGRKKHLYGIYKKMQKHHANLSSVLDIHAFRIIVDSVGECYRALGIIHSLYKPVPGKFKDYIAIPKANGYQSLHTILFGPFSSPIEIQIRTKEMDQTANNGIAAHWLYKTNDKENNFTHLRTQQWVNNLLEVQKNSGSSLEFIENVKIDLFPDEVYVFTPKGNIIELPQGATAVDLAYAIHTDIGNTCVAARIDRKFLPLSTSLLNGQIVSIITSPTAKPNPAWLNFVTTGKARSSIKNYLKNQKRGELILLGKQLLDKIFTDIKINFNKIDQEVINNFLKKNNFTELNDLYESIGLGNLFATSIAYQLTNTQSINQESNQEIKPILIRGAEGMAINLPNCCYPIPGDQIVGFLTKGHGLDIHTSDCPILKKLQKHSERYLPVSWADNIEGNFRVALEVEMVHKSGTLAELTKTTALHQATIDDISIGERGNGYCCVSIHLLVKNLTHLEQIMLDLSNLPIVTGVTRKKISSDI